MAAINEIFESIKANHNLNFSLKDEQIRVLQLLSQKETVLAVLPTGYGKSVLYGVLPFILNQMNPDVKHTSLVVSPLIILMEHQVQRWTQSNMKCIALNSLTDFHKAEKLTYYDIIFASPEFVYDHLSQFLSEHLRGQIALVAFDEAHCLTEWGTQSFRPKYAHLADLLSVLSEAAVLVTTGTMSSAMRESTMKSLHIGHYQTVACSPDRPEIFIDSMSPDLENLKWLCEELLIYGRQCSKTIIYCRTIKDINNLFMMFVDELNESIYANGDSTSVNNRHVEMFSAALSEQHKSRILEQFTTDSNLRVVIATIAFGMGIDIPDIRNIVLWGAPESICHFWQQIGRCGRDGRSSKAILHRKPIPSVMESSKELKAIFQPDSTQCIRKKVLEYLWLPQMGAVESPQAQCLTKCRECQCPRCKCCVVCRKACMCNA